MSNKHLVIGFNWIFLANCLLPTANFFIDISADKINRKENRFHKNDKKNVPHIRQKKSENKTGH